MRPSHHERLIDGLLLVLGASLLSSAACAADAHLAVQAKPGDMVLLRNVNTRPAYRPAPPGMALMVDPSPRRELARALGADELSDADFAGLDAGSPQHGGHGTVVQQMVGNALGGTLGGGNGSNGTTAGLGIGNAMAGPLGAVGDTTRGIGDQVRGALSQLPAAMPAPTGH
ncbi:hypothetical protein RHOFW510R12_08525 [Rhodanobacter sp. FW510-R12]|uniref:hypothetical protein n=1 Tax=unclassified Rhodanobacter TaxID=2621553 RepID=UPI0007AA0E1A|nr:MULTISPECIES: hypothetical protein [unclassified Rhodanobacter]KZC18035.1 hypothetical protein RHOFW104R8_08405 [Rhodanobacter sp. FW104-R8]KZC28132.1 hypothetical protein RhoFW510T8_12050 [Rhodanobacter sp. FW510-T8]KZC33331.1 hypothetical protein RhoFW510R10_08330 [Rhodanobacter sp. FW510-R10]